MKIGQSSYKMYSNIILYFQEFITILSASTKKVTYIYSVDHFFNNKIQILQHQ